MTYKRLVELIGLASIIRYNISTILTFGINCYPEGDDLSICDKKIS